MKHLHILPDPSSRRPLVPRAERDQQLLDGLRWADALLYSFGVRVASVDVAALVALRVLEWADPDMRIADVTRLLSTSTERRTPESH